jgi:hypothetical protein
VNERFEAGRPGCRRSASAWAWTGLILVSGMMDGARGEDAKEPAKPEAPRIALVQPAVIEAGEKARLRLRGQALDTVTTVRFHGFEPGDEVEISGRGEAPAISGYDAKRVGDRKLDVNLRVPADAPLGTNASVWVIGPGGESARFGLLLVPAGTLKSEKEPNDGFRDAPRLPLGLWVRGAMEAKGDVDVFRVELESGRTFRAEVFAERLGSTLDPMLTVYDRRQAVVKSVDDTVGRDPVVEFEVRESGEYFIAVSSASDKAAASHEYVLNVTQP